MADTRIEIELAVRDTMSAAVKEIGRHLEEVSRKAVAAGEGGGIGLERFNRQSITFNDQIKQNTKSLIGVSDVIGAMTKNLMSPIGLAAGFIAVTKSLDNFSVGQLQLHNLARDSGLAAENIVEMQRKLTRAGVPLEQATASIMNVASKLGEIKTYPFGDLSAKFAETNAWLNTHKTTLSSFLTSSATMKEKIDAISEAYHNGSKEFQKKIRDLTQESATFWEENYRKLDSSVARIVLPPEKVAKFHKQVEELTVVWENLRDPVKFFVIDKIYNIVANPPPQEGNRWTGQGTYNEMLYGVLPPMSWSDWYKSKTVEGWMPGGPPQPWEKVPLPRPAPGQVELSYPQPSPPEFVRGEPYLGRASDRFARASARAQAVKEREEAAKAAEEAYGPVRPRQFPLLETPNAGGGPTRVKPSFGEIDLAKEFRKEQDVGGAVEALKDFLKEKEKPTVARKKSWWEFWKSNALFGGERTAFGEDSREIVNVERDSSKTLIEIRDTLQKAFVLFGGGGGNGMIGGRAFGGGPGGGGGGNVHGFRPQSPGEKEAAGITAKQAGIAPIFPVEKGVNWENMDAELVSRLNEAYKNAPPEAKKGFKVISGFRTYEQQLAAWYRLGGGSRGMVARPGTSEHERMPGMAVDVEDPTGHFHRVPGLRPLPGDYPHLRLGRMGQRLYQPKSEPKPEPAPEAKGSGAVGLFSGPIPDERQVAMSRAEMRPSGLSLMERLDPREADAEDRRNEAADEILRLNRQALGWFYDLKYARLLRGPDIKADSFGGVDWNDEINRSIKNLAMNESTRRMLAVQKRQNRDALRLQQIPDDRETVRNGMKESDAGSKGEFNATVRLKNVPAGVSHDVDGDGFKTLRIEKQPQMMDI